jgi:hypothetical protein
MNTKVLLSAVVIFLAVLSCNKNEIPDNENKINQKAYLQREKAAIIEILNNETKAAFERDYGRWENYWVHDPDITKTYIDVTTHMYSESVGWKEISSFVKKFIEEHPKPEPVPELLKEINVRLYETGAWVTYEQLDSLRGLKKETRLMEKINGVWKIAGMQTTIYGFKKPKTGK